MKVKKTSAQPQGAATTENERQIRIIKAESGKAVIGYLCCFAPPELISAAGAIPYRISGEPGMSTAPAEAYVEPYGCTYVRNILTRAVEGRLDFLDGLVIAHSCDMVQRLYGIWTYYHPLPYSYLFNVPHQLSPWAQRFFKRELGFFRESLEAFTGNAVDPKKLNDTVCVYNRNRALVRALYDLRRQTNPALEGSEMLELLLAGGALPPEKFAALLNKKLADIKRQKPPDSKRPRVMVWGSIIDDPLFYAMIEEAGAVIVTDDTCIGFRTWEKDVPLSGDPDQDLTDHYFVNFQCPRTDRGPGRNRFAYLLDRARAYKVDGVIGYCISFCDPHKFDYPDLRDYFKDAGLPMLLLDDNYSFEPAEAIKTRLKAFIEMIGTGDQK